MRNMHRASFPRAVWSLDELSSGRLIWAVPQSDLAIVSLQFRFEEALEPSKTIRLVVSGSDRILKSKMFVFQIHDLNISAV